MYTICVYECMFILIKKPIHTLLVKSLNYLFFNSLKNTKHFNYILSQPIFQNLQINSFNMTHVPE